MRERRKFVRVISNIKLRYQRNHLPHTGAKSADLGGGGIRFCTNEEIRKGTNLTLEIDVPGRPRTVPAKASVVWCHKIDENSWEIGTVFTEIDIRDRDKVLMYVYSVSKETSSEAEPTHPENTG